MNPTDSWECDGLLFSNFSFGFGNADPSLFTLSIQGTTVTLTGPMAVQDGAEDNFVMSYQVTAVDSLIGVSEVSFFTPAVVQGSGTANRMQAASDFENGSSTNVASLTTFALPNLDDFDSSAMIAPETLLTVQSAASLRSASGGSAQLPSMSNTFTLVPEPTTAAMLALGLLGIAAGAPRRR